MEVYLTDGILYNVNKQTCPAQGTFPFGVNRKIDYIGFWFRLIESDDESQLLSSNKVIEAFGTFVTQ